MFYKSNTYTRAIIIIYGLSSAIDVIIIIIIVNIIITIISRTTAAAKKTITRRRIHTIVPGISFDILLLIININYAYNII